MKKAPPIDISLETLIDKLNACYDLEELEINFLELQNEKGDTDTDVRIARSTYQDERKSLEEYFLTLADLIFEAGGFKSREEARKAITIREEDRRDYLGPSGVVPDDGTINPDEEADGILCLLKKTEYKFQAPVAKCFTKSDHILGMSRGDLSASLALTFSPLLNIGKSLDPQEGTSVWGGYDSWIWIYGTINGQNYRHLREEVELFLQEVQGALLVFEFASFRNLSFLSPPPMTFGRKETYNSGVYVGSVSARIAPQLTFNGLGSRGSDADPLQQLLLQKLFQAPPAKTKEIRQSLRMFLRSFDCWNLGERAMMMAITLEGLLLDKKSKDDLSARLQDSVAYWLGGSAPKRAEIRKTIAGLYTARSKFVHEGESIATEAFIEEVTKLVRGVILKEVRELSLA